MLVSIHAPHTGCDTPAAAAACARRSFNPRTPHGVRHHLLCKSLCKNQRFNPRTPHGVRRGADHIAVGVVAVSIHAPHTGCDILQSLHSLARHVSIHAPHTGCDLTASTAETYCVEFQSTHPTRGATRMRWPSSISTICFNPRTPHGVRLAFGDNRLIGGAFQSTHPTRGATGVGTSQPQAETVSIHAPHTGCDIYY